MKRLLIYIISISIILIVLGCTTLQEYEATGPEEKAIVNQVSIFQKSFDKEYAYSSLDLFSDDARIMVGRERKILSKQEYTEHVSNRIKKNIQLDISYVGAPKIRIDGNTAIVKISMVLLDADMNAVVINFILDFVKQNGKWLIKNSRYNY